MISLAPVKKSDKKHTGPYTQKKKKTANGVAYGKDPPKTGSTGSYAYYGSKDGDHCHSPFCRNFAAAENLRSSNWAYAASREGGWARPFRAAANS
jgi:hypothetical protein